jgi:hypothetical protein
MTIVARDNPSGAGGASETNMVSLNAGSAGDIHTAQSFFRLAGQQLSVRFSGNGPLMLKSFEGDIFDEQVETRG